MSAPAERGLVDTNVIILFDDLDQGELPDHYLISAVTMAELAAGPHSTTDPVERATRIERIQLAESYFEPLPFDDRVARRYGHIVAATIAAGRTPKPRKLDLMIAATASANRLPLFTVTPDDFKGLEGLLDLRPVTHPDQPSAR